MPMRPPDDYWSSALAPTSTSAAAAAHGTRCAQRAEAPGGSHAGGAPADALIAPGAERPASQSPLRPGPPHDPCSVPVPPRLVRHGRGPRGARRADARRSRRRPPADPGQDRGHAGGGAVPRGRCAARAPGIRAHGHHARRRQPRLGHLPARELGAQPALVGARDHGRLRQRALGQRRRAARPRRRARELVRQHRQVEDQRRGCGGPGWHPARRSRQVGEEHRIAAGHPSCHRRRHQPDTDLHAHAEGAGPRSTCAA